MSKGAATEKSLSRVHSQLARVFSRVLEKYEKGLEALDSIPTGEIEADMIEVLAEISEPNPAMLSAIAKFLKDNDIGMDTEEVADLNSTERRLAEKREARRKAGIDLTVVPFSEAM